MALCEPQPGWGWGALALHKHGWACMCVLWSAGGGCYGISYCIAGSLGEKVVGVTYRNDLQIYLLACPLSLLVGSQQGRLQRKIENVSWVTVRCCNCHKCELLPNPRIAINLLLECCNRQDFEEQL